jgi:hypothetical protein
MNIIKKYKVKLDKMFMFKAYTEIIHKRPQSVPVFIYQFQKLVIFYKRWTSLLHNFLVSHNVLRVVIFGES